MKRYAQMKKIIEFFNSPKISRMGEYMLTGRYIMVLFALASVFVIFDISVAGVLTFACITGITLVCVRTFWRRFRLFCSCAL